MRPSAYLRLSPLALLLLGCSSLGEGPETAVPARSRPSDATLSLARLQLGTALLGADVQDVLRASVGTVDDLLLDAGTGQLVGVLAQLELDGGTEPRILDAQTVYWRRVGERAALVVTRPRAELSAGTGFAAAFTSPPTTTVAGRIMAVEAGAAGAEGALVVKVHDADNLLHRVLVEPAGLVRRRLPTLADGGAIEASGVMTRDEKGKLLIASTLEQGDAALVLRDDSGALEWERLAEEFTSARGLAGRELQTEDGATLTVSDFVVDRERAAVAFVVVDVEGVARALDWERFARADGRLELERDDLALLPRVGPDGSVEGYP